MVVDLLHLYVPLAVMVSIVLFLCCVKLELGFLYFFESEIGSIHSKDSLLEQFHPVFLVFKMFNKRIVELVLNFSLSFDNGFNQLLYMLPHLQISHETVDFQLPLPWQNFLVILVFN